VSALLSFAQNIQQQAIIDNHRQILRLQGDLVWCYQQATFLITHLQQPYFWCGPSPSAITSTPFKQILGQEVTLLIINAYDSFDANAFAASEGALRGGGLLLLISPTEIDKNDLFHQYLNSQFLLYNFMSVRQSHPLPISSTCLPQTAINNDLYLTQQKSAITAIIKTVTGHRHRPLVLTANRGRGKSAALGIAAAHLLNTGIKTVLVCAPNKQATVTLFKHARSLLNAQHQAEFSVLDQEKSIQFIAPDRLLAEKPKCDLLIIDEAAALPVPTLEALAHHYARLVFATTVHGYEGSGRGFALRFQKQLNKIAPQWRQVHLDQPIRWAVNDPLESFTLNSLCLTESASQLPHYQAHQTVQFEKLDRHQLLHNKALLQDTFSLLVLAHYQTKPSDLEKLLNDTALHIFVVRQNKQLLGVALINDEGGFEPMMCENIWRGTRRVQGHLVAQSLTFHSACKQAASYRYARIQRIAIHPSLQNLGLGKQFISHLTDWAKKQKFDHLCASFGATAGLLSFWQQLAFSTLRIGFSIDHSSGTHSVIVNKPLSNQGKLLHAEIHQQFSGQFAIQLSRHLQQMDAELVANILQEFSKKQPQSVQLGSYLQGNLPYEFVEPVLITLMLTCNLKSLSKTQQCLTIQKILQNNSWEEICKKHHLTGKKQAQSALKSAITQLFAQEENYAPR
jgi:tRNA(Met) cytidine acetyltransferase